MLLDVIPSTGDPYELIVLLILAVFGLTLLSFKADKKSK